MDIDHIGEIEIVDAEKEDVRAIKIDSYIIDYVPFEPIGIFSNN